MNGAEIFNFTLRVVPEAISKLLDRAALRMEDVDLFVFHQANRYMLEHLRRKLDIPDEKLPIIMAHSGNTVSSSIPILLKDLETASRLKKGQCLMLLGFGVGYSWGGSIVHW
jgi:3-oxoacyl-[acyl-carrier-protein] synthase-3